MLIVVSRNPNPLDYVWWFNSRGHWSVNEWVWLKYISQFTISWDSGQEISIATVQCILFLKSITPVIVMDQKAIYRLLSCLLA